MVIEAPVADREEWMGSSSRRRSYVVEGCFHA
jgi:hypothetical protein